MTYGSLAADQISTSVTGVSLGPGNATNFKNRIINGGMVLDQRNSGASVTPIDLQYTLDRWYANLSQSSKFTVQQNKNSVTPPVGFTNYLGVTSSSAYTLAATDYFAVAQVIEGLNMSDLGWGTANAKTITISFWVYSSLTGVFGASLRNSAENYWYPFSYTINSANTWEQKSVTIAGPTSGTWLTTNGVGTKLWFSLGTGTTYSGPAGSWTSTTYASVTGATSVVSTNGATWYITGVQFEVGSIATGFEFRDYGTQLLQCQRYYEKSYDIGTAPGTAASYAGVFFLSLGYLSSNSNVGNSIPIRVRKRTSPTITTYSTLTGAAGYARNAGGGDTATNLFGTGETGGLCYVSGTTGAVDFSCQWVASAEL